MKVFILCAVLIIITCTYMWIINSLCTGPHKYYLLLYLTCKAWRRERWIVQKSVLNFPWKAFNHFNVLYVIWYNVEIKTMYKTTQQSLTTAPVSASLRTEHSLNHKGFTFCWLLYWIVLQMCERRTTHSIHTTPYIIDTLLRVPAGRSCRADPVCLWAAVQAP